MTTARPLPRCRGRLQLADGGDPHHRAALLVGGGQVDLGARCPSRGRRRGSAKIWRTRHSAVLRLLLDLEQLRPAGVRARCPGRRTRPSRRPSRPPRCPRPSRPRASSSPSSWYFSSAASSTRRNSALRTSTRKARALAVTGLTWSARSAASLGASPPRGWPAAPTRRAGWSRPGAPSRRARRSGPAGPRTSGRPGRCAPAPCTRRPGSAARCPRCGPARSTR